MSVNGASLPVPLHAPQLTASQFRAATAAVMMTILLSALDQTIVSVAVPTIARQLGHFEWMAWVISGYLIASTAVTPLYGKFSDLFGRQRVMSFSIIAFMLTSAACALAQSLPQLVLARVLQGAAGGGLIALAQAVIADVVPLRDRGRYQGYVSIVWAVASMVGPVVGGVLTEVLSWPWIFWINLPVGLLALVLVQQSLGALPKRGTAPKIDAVGALLLLAGVSALLIPITRVGQGAAWFEAGNLIGAAAALLLLIAFIAQERRHPDAIVPMHLFGNPVIVASCGLLFICFFNFIALSVLVPLRLQLAAGFSPGDAGLHLLPMTLAIPAAAFFSGRWLSRTGRVLPMQRTGVILVPLALLGLGFAPASGMAAALLLIAVGFGMGLQMPSTLITVQQSVARPLIGTVTAFTVFFRLLGGAIGIAVLSSVLLALLRVHAPGSPQLAGHGMEALLDAAHGPHPASAMASAAADAAFRQVFWIAAAVSLIPLWLVRRLPDLHLHEAAGRAAQASAAADL